MWPLGKSHSLSVAALDCPCLSGGWWREVESSRDWLDWRPTMKDLSNAARFPTVDVSLPSHHNTHTPFIIMNLCAFYRFSDKKESLEC